jgi:hypothetical protein
VLIYFGVVVDDDVVGFFVVVLSEVPPVDAILVGFVSEVAKSVVFVSIELFSSVVVLFVSSVISVVVDVVANCSQLHNLLGFTSKTQNFCPSSYTNIRKHSD